MSKGRWLCIWCHRIETYTEINQVAFEDKHAGKQYVINQKLKIGGCELCDANVTKKNTYCFDFDHIDPETKTCSVSQLCKISEIKAEIAKCRLLCCKCHRLHSIQQEKDTREQRLETRKLKRQSKA